MSKALPPTMLQAAAVAMQHALSPSQWAIDRLQWTPDQWQRDLLEAPDRQIAVCCSRQSGKSSTTATLAAHTSIFQPGSLTLLLSPSQRQASELLTKVRSVLTHPGLNTKLEQNAATSLELSNGSRVVSLPSSPDAIRGYSKPALVIEDEASWVTDEVHLSLRPMMATSTHSKFILLSTPAGRSGHFYTACHSPNWRRFKVTAHQCPRISQAFLDNELREGGDLFFAREFLCDFSDSEFSFFGSDLIAAAFNCEIPAITLELFT